jgi:hypothetical protein
VRGDFMENKFFGKIPLNPPLPKRDIHTPYTPLKRGWRILRKPE